MMTSSRLPTPLIGVTSCLKPRDGLHFHTVGDKYVEAVVLGSGGLPVLVPAIGDRLDPDALLDRLDGLLVTGSPSNVAPSHYGGPQAREDNLADPARDATTLPLIRRAVARGVPLLAICRGIQELNVALGGTLATEIQERPGALDHRAAPSDNQDERFAIRQTVTIKPGSCLAQAFGAGDIRVNSVHRQGLDRVAPRLQVEAVAEDGTVEAVSVRDAKGFAVGVQWHPEYWVTSDEASAKIFRMFGEATRAYGAARLGVRDAAE